MLPIRTSIQPRRTPYANYILIGITVFVFFVSHCPTERIPNWPHSVYPRLFYWQLIPTQFGWWQLVTYAFLHGGYLHLIGNMFFLYLFGQTVNDHLGHVRYILFYLTGAVLSGLGHTLMNSSSSVPTLGASGAVAAVTGAYLVLFPRSVITVLYLLIFIIGTVDVRAMWFILFKMILLDNWLAAGSSQIAYDAHLAGYTFGILGVLGMLRLGWISRSGDDLLVVWQRWCRRRDHQGAVVEGYNPFGDPYERKVVQAREVPKTPDQLQREVRIQSLRRAVQQRLADQNLATAAQAYRELLSVDENQILPQQALLDVANQMVSEKDYPAAAQAYEQFLTYYKSYQHIEQVILMLGLVYARYLSRTERAHDLLQQAVGRLTDPGQLDMCKAELGRLRG